MGGKFKLPFGELTVTFDERDLIWAGFRMKDFVPAADLEVRGLRNRYRTPSIGAALAASIEPLEGDAGKQSMRIPPRLKIPVTAFLRLDDPRAALASGKLDGKLEFYTPDSARSLKIEGVEVPIEYETTSALALSLEGAPVWDFEIAGFRSGDFTIGGANLREGLFMMHPAQARPHAGRACARYSLEPGALGRADQRTGKRSKRFGKLRDLAVHVQHRQSRRLFGCFCVTLWRQLSRSSTPTIKKRV